MEFVVSLSVRTSLGRWIFRGRSLLQESLVQDAGVHLGEGTLASTG